MSLLKKFFHNFFCTCDNSKKLELFEKQIASLQLSVCFLYEHVDRISKDQDQSETQNKLNRLVDELKTSTDNLTKTMDT